MYTCQQKNTSELLPNDSRTSDDPKKSKIPIIQEFPKGYNKARPVIILPEVLLQLGTEWNIKHSEYLGIA